MTSSYRPSAEAELNDTAMDAYVLAVTAKQGRLNVKAADELVHRLRSHADRMIYEGDREILRTAADGFERLGDRIKAGAAARTRAKASNGSRTGSRPAPDYAAMNRQQDAEQMSLGGPFDRTEFEDVERRRSEAQNATLRERQRKLEAQRRAQVAQHEQPERPWWR